jgi:HemY protein
MAERQLWGKARLMLDLAVADTELPTASRCLAWLTLASLAEQEGDPTRASACYREAATG